MLRLTLFLATLLLPTVASAQCSEEHQAQSCADGYVWNADTQSCVQQITG